MNSLLSLFHEFIGFLLAGKATEQQFEAFVSQFRDKVEEVVSQIEKFFIVGDVFRHCGGKGYAPMYIWKDAQNLLFTPNKDHRIDINNTIGKLRGYTLLTNMNDSNIQKNAKSIPISKDEFFLVLFLLIVNTKLGKEVLGYKLDTSKCYLFYVQIACEKLVTVSLFPGNDEWNVDCLDFNLNDAWLADAVLLYFGTAK